jgi:hypothetical protein
VEAEKAYVDLLDSKCEAFKEIAPLGGVGWFWQIWSVMLDGSWGLLLYVNGTLKFPFAPRTDC